MGDIVKVVRGGRFIGWYIRYKDADGRRKQRASHQPTRELARRMLVEVEARIARGRLGMPEPAPQSPTVAALCQQFLVEYSRPKIKDLSRYRRYAETALRRALPFIGELRADAITPAEIQDLRDALLRRGARNSVRLTLSLLGTVYSWANQRGLATHNPLRRAELPPRLDAVDYLSADEVRALLETASRRAAQGSFRERCLHARVHFVLHTGLRKGELLALRWRDLDLLSGRLTVARSFDGTPKSNKPRHLHLPDAVRPMLEAWRRECPTTRDGLVFPGRRRDGSFDLVRDSSDMLGLPALLHEAGCRPIARAWHTLRHTMASHYMMQGGSLLALSKILGHADLKMTLVYAHLAPDFLGSEMNRLKY